MKKISTVLLVLVLVGSVAFAGFTGNATTRFGYNMDSGEYGFIKQSTAVSVDVTLLELLGEQKGEGDIYASIKATLNFAFDNADETGVDDTTALILGDSLDFDHAKIFSDNWYVSILSAARAANFATSAVDTKELDKGFNALAYKYDPANYAADLRSRDRFDRTSGVEVGYNGWVLGVAFKGDHIDTPEVAPVVTVDETGYKAFGSLATPDFELGDGLTLKLGAAGFTEDYAATGADSAASAHIKVAYSSDDLSASVAADAIYDNSVVDFDVAAKAAYDIVSMDAYFATKSLYVYTDGLTGGGPSVAAPNNLLSAKVAVDLDPMTVTVTGKDLVNAQDLSASVKFQVNDELAVTARGGYKMSTKVIKGGADLEYKAADFTAKAGGTYYTQGEDATLTKDRIQLNASVESKTIVPGATLKLTYAGDDITDASTYTVGDFDYGKKGAVYAEVKIAF